MSTQDNDFIIDRINFCFYIKMTHKIYYMNFSFLFAKTQKLCNSFYFNIFLHFKIDVKEQMLCIFSDLMHMFIKKIILRYLHK